MFKKGIVFAFIIAASRLAYAQELTPVITGKVDISIKKGTIVCDLTVANIPRVNDYYIRLNSGMNILNFKNLDTNSVIRYEKSLDDTLSSGESSAYFFPENTRKGKFLPNQFAMRYTGMFPVATDTTTNFSAQDWKGNIAFNGYSLRTDGSQSCWYPIVYDITKDVALSNVRYDLQVTCSDCKQLYVNGNAPVKGPRARLKSDVPVEISMYLGKYQIERQDNTYFLNPDISSFQIQEFGKTTNAYKKFYETNLQIPYKAAVTYIQTTPTSKNNTWLFVSYPAIFNIGRGEYGLKALFNEQTSNEFKSFIAHELGHYYFGTYKVFNSVLGDAFSEGFTEYLALNLTKNMLSDSIYQRKLTKKIEKLKEFQAIPFSRITSGKAYTSRELYVYYYTPVILTAIQREIGEKQMWTWLRTILVTPTERTDYHFLFNTLSMALNDQRQAKALAARYFNDDQALANAIRVIQQP